MGFPASAHLFHFLNEYHQKEMAVYQPRMVQNILQNQRPSPGNTIDGLSKHKAHNRVGYILAQKESSLPWSLKDRKDLPLEKKQ